MLQSPVNRWTETKMGSFQLATKQPAQSRLYVNRFQIELYFGKANNTCELDTLSKQGHSDSGTESDLSITASPLHLDSEPKKASVAVSTEDSPLFANKSGQLACVNSMPTPYIPIDQLKYFSFPLYGIHEESIQTAEPSAAVTVVKSGKRTPPRD